MVGRIRVHHLCPITLNSRQTVFKMACRVSNSRMACRICLLSHRLAIWLVNLTISSQKCQVFSCSALMELIHSRLVKRSRLLDKETWYLAKIRSPRLVVMSKTSQLRATFLIIWDSSWKRRLNHPCLATWTRSRIRWTCSRRQISKKSLIRTFLTYSRSSQFNQTHIRLISHKLRLLFHRT